VIRFSALERGLHQREHLRTEPLVERRLEAFGAKHSVKCFAFSGGDSIKR